MISLVQYIHVLSTMEKACHGMTMCLMYETFTLQDNEVDGAYILYERVMAAERNAVQADAENVIMRALEMQEYLFGEAHPEVCSPSIVCRYATCESRF
jgi:hypothetical protein